MTTGTGGLPRGAAIGPALAWCLLLWLAVGHVARASARNASQPELEPANEDSCRQPDDRRPDCAQRPASASIAELESAWHLNYFEEQTPNFQVLIKEKSLDERLANVIYTASTNRIVDLDFHAYDSGDAREDAANMRRAAGPQVDDELCGAHLRAMLGLADQLERRLERARAGNGSLEALGEQHLRLARVLDSFGHYSSGLLTGKAHNLGSPEECIGSELLLAEVGARPRVASRLCWAQLSIGKHLDEELRARPLLKFETKRQLIKTTICLPESCHSKSFAADGGRAAQERLQLVKRLLDSQFKLPKQLYLDENLPLEGVYCNADMTSLPPSGRLLLLAGALYLGLVVYATYATNAAGAANQCRALKCFDLNSSFKEFLEEEGASAPPRPKFAKINLDTLNVVKVFGCMFVVNGHARLVTIGTALDGVRAYKQAQEDPVVLMSLMGTMVVDTFLALTGLYLTITVLRKAAERRDRAARKKLEPAPGAEQGPRSAAQADHSGAVFFKSWFQIVVRRYARLVPMLCLFFWFKKGLLINLSSGLTFGDDAFNAATEYGACRRESWFSPLTLASSFIPIGRQCLPQAWSVTDDVLLCAALAPLMLLIGSRPRLAIGLGALLALLGTGAALNAFEAIDPRVTLRIRDFKFDGSTLMFGLMSHLYTYPHFRFCSMVAGMLAGYALFRYERDEIRRWPRWFAGPVTKLALVTLATSFATAGTLPLFAQMLPRALVRSFFGHLITTGRLLWAVINAVLLTRMASDWSQSYLMRLASRKFWRVLVKLNYVLFLIHLDYILYELSLRSPGIFSNSNVHTLFVSAYSFSLFVGGLIYICLENPIDKFVRSHLLAWLR